MSSSISAIVATEQDSHLMKLPLEIRESVYRHLLVAEYTMTELKMTSKDYNCNRQSIQAGPDQTYDFHTAILGTCRKICEEARDLCHRENNFVCLTSRHPSTLGQKICERGMQTIANGSKARSFWNIAMTITLDPASLGGWPQGGSRFCHTGGWLDAAEDGRPWSYIFCSAELPNFCRLLLEISMGDRSVLLDTVLYIDIDPTIWNGQATGMDSNPAGLLRLRKLLEPLRQLHSFGAALVEGSLSGSYKKDINNSVCKDCPMAMDIIETALVAQSQGDDHFGKGQLLRANLKYKSALNYVRSCCWVYDEQDLIMSSGPFSGLEAMQAAENLEIRLQARIAATYLESGMLRMARIYTERAVDPRRPYDRRGNKMYHPLQIEPWERVVFAEILHVSAQISYIHGGLREAQCDLRRAGELNPFTDEQNSRYEAWKAHGNRLMKRRAKQGEARELQKLKQTEKAEESSQVVWNWKNKGDRQMRNGISNVAITTYQTALRKLDLLSAHCPTCFIFDSTTFQGCRSLRFKLHASIAAAYSMSRKYKEVGQLTDSALKCNQAHYVGNHRPYGCCSHTCRDDKYDWEKNQALDYLKIHYCKAIALKHTGDTVRAIEHMEKALVFDPGDAQVFTQLLSLKQKRKEEEDMLRRNRLEKLNALQDQLRRKQALRRMKVGAKYEV